MLRCRARRGRRCCRGGGGLGGHVLGNALQRRLCGGRGRLDERLECVPHQRPREAVDVLERRHRRRSRAGGRGCGRSRGGTDCRIAGRWGERGRQRLCHAHREGRPADRAARAAVRAGEHHADDMHAGCGGRVADEVAPAAVVSDACFDECRGRGWTAATGGVGSRPNCGHRRWCTAVRCRLRLQRDCDDKHVPAACRAQRARAVSRLHNEAGAGPRSAAVQ